MSDTASAHHLHGKQHQSGFHLGSHLTAAALCSQELLVTSKQNAQAKGQLENNLENTLAFSFAIKPFSLMGVPETLQERKIFFF